MIVLQNVWEQLYGIDYGFCDHISARSTGKKKKKMLRTKKSIKHRTEAGNKSRKVGECRDLLKMYKGPVLFLHQHSFSFPLGFLVGLAIVTIILAQSVSPSSVNHHSSNILLHDKVVQLDCHHKTCNKTLCRMAVCNISAAQQAFTTALENLQKYEYLFFLHY